MQIKTTHFQRSDGRFPWHAQVTLEDGSVHEGWGNSEEGAKVNVQDHVEDYLRRKANMPKTVKAYHREAFENYTTHSELNTVAMVPVADMWLSMLSSHREEIEKCTKTDQVWEIIKNEPATVALGTIGKVELLSMYELDPDMQADYGFDRKTCREWLSARNTSPAPANDLFDGISIAIFALGETEHLSNLCRKNGINYSYASGDHECNIGRMIEHFSLYAANLY